MGNDGGQAHVVAARAGVVLEHVGLAARGEGHVVLERVASASEAESAAGDSRPQPDVLLSPETDLLD